jgi:hypothetical protein
VLVELFERRRLAQHDLVHSAEIARGGLPSQPTHAGRRGLIGGAQGAADGVADNEREVARGMQRSRNAPSSGRTP